jgi:predicted nuclease of predicted toxin-antitoxin system
MIIIADENVDHELINILRKQQTVISIYHEMRGLSDAEIIALAQHQQVIILTEDKDFGEYVFAHKIKNISVVFMRYNFKDRMEMFNIVATLFSNNPQKLVHKFTTLKITSIRTRDID